MPVNDEQIEAAKRTERAAHAWCRKLVKFVDEHKALPPLSDTILWAADIADEQGIDIRGLVRELWRDE